MVNERIPPGHKVATRAIAPGEPVRRYSQVIGFATRDDRPGDHVHVHNLGGVGRRLRARLRLRRGLRRRRWQPRGDLPGHRAARRPRCHAQLHRHPVDGELLGDRSRAHRRRFRRRPLPGELGLPQRRRRGRADAQDRLRHGRWARAWPCCDARWRATRATPTSRLRSSSASAARPTRSRALRRPGARDGERAATLRRCRTSAAPRRRSSAASRW